MRIKYFHLVFALFTWLGVILLIFLEAVNLKPVRDVCAEKGGLYVNETCIKVERIDLGEISE